MGVLLGGTTADYFYYPGGPSFQKGQQYTIMAWVNIRADNNQVATQFGLASPYVSAIVEPRNYDIVKLTTDGTKLRITTRHNATFTTSTMTNDMTIGTSGDVWDHITLVRESITSVKLYMHRNNALNGATLSTTELLTQTPPDVTRDTDVANLVFGHMGGLPFGLTSDNALSQAFCGIKVWTTALTAAQIQAEAIVYKPFIETSSLWGWWPALSSTNLKDYSGNGRDFITAGTVSNSENAQNNNVIWGANRGPMIQTASAPLPDYNPFGTGIGVRANFRRMSHSHRR